MNMLSQRDPIELSDEGVMRRSQVCKHQVCDYCSGRFGMVTHRWWGNKFCKRTCKNAYLRENDRTLSRWVIPGFSFAGGACFAAALAVSVLTLLLLASANAAPSEEQPAAGVLLEFNKGEGTLYIDLIDNVPPALAGTAQTVYGLVAVGGATAVLMIVSGWLYTRFGAGGFWAMALLSVAALPAIWSLQGALSKS